LKPLREDQAWPHVWCRALVLVLATLAGLAPFAHAQKAPGLGYAYPPAIPIGTTSQVQLGGFDFTADMEWFVHDSQARIKSTGLPGDYLLVPPPYWSGPRTSTPAMPIPREVAAGIVVDRAAQPGFFRFQVANANGSSSTALFYLSDSPEIVEARSRDFPQSLPPLPIAVSGRLSRLTEVDRYTLRADRDGLISLDLMVRRLGADFHGVLQVHDSAGTQIADLADTEGFDGGVTFAARQGETYTISLHDVDFRGDRAYVYRLAATRGPRVLCTIPAAGKRGTTRPIAFVGLGVATGTPTIESVRQSVSFPADPTRKSHIHLLKGPGGDVEVSIPVSDLDEVERDPAATAAPGVPVAVAAPAAVTGRFSADSADHVYSWRAQKGESWKLALQSSGIGSRVDVALAVFGPDGKPLGECDDLPGTTDAELVIRVPANGEYRCSVRNLSSRTGTADRVYRLQIQREADDFALNVPQQVNLPLGGKAEVALHTVRSGGFDAAITITVEGLPAGVRTTGELVIPAGKNECRVVLESAPGAAVVARPIRFRGTGKTTSGLVSHDALALAAGSLCPRWPEEHRIPQVLLALTMNAPLEVRVVEREIQHDVHRGTTFPAELEIVRKNGFMGNIRVEMSAQQARYIQGIHGSIIDVPAGAKRVFYPCFMPEWLGTDLTERIVVHGVAAVPDPTGKVRYLTKPGDCRITMIMEGALLKLTAEAPERAIHPGESVGVPVRISRSAKLPVAATVALQVPDEVAGLLRADPLVLGPDRDQGTLSIRSTSNPRLEGPWSLRLKATALHQGRWPVISQADLLLGFCRP
jgi:hypothetical protein